MYFKEGEIRRGKDVRNKTKILVTEFSVHPHFFEEAEILWSFLGTLIICSSFLSPQKRPDSC